MENTDESPSGGTCAPHSRERERNESRSDWIHAEITDRRKRRAGESQTRKAVITVL